MAEQRLSQLADRLEKVTSRLESVAKGKGGSGGGANENTEIVEEFDVFLSKKFKTYLELSAKLGGDVQKHSGVVNECFKECRNVVVLASKHKNPKPNVLKDVLKPLGTKVNAVQQFAEKNRGSKQFNHLMTVKEGIGCAGWVSVSPKPAPYVKECFNQSLFYGNRVLKEFKGKEDVHVDWMRAYTGTIQELEEYVRTFHATGLLWNADGTECTGAAPSGGAPPPPAPGGPPPPPPPAIQPPSDVPSKPSSGGDRPDTSALIASLNKGSAITSGLKKVTNDMKTHKNPELRASSVVKADTTKSKTASSAPKAATQVKKPPVFELRGQKWMVENQENNNDLEITITDPKYAVFVYKCAKCTIKISNKCNSILIDSCKRVGLVFEGVISAVEIINSQSIQVQALGQCHTVSIDKTDGCQVFLSKECINAEIITAKSSEMNISIPTGDDGEFSEHAVPEQFRTKWNGSKLVTECTDING